MKLDKLFAVLVLFLILGTVTTGSVGIMSSRHFGSLMSGVMDVDLPRFLTITDVRKNIRSQLVLQKDIILSDSAAEQQKVDETIKKTHTETLKKIDAYKKMMKDDSTSSLADLEKSYEAVKQDENIVREKTLAGDRAGAAVISKRKKGNPTWEDVIKDLISKDEASLKTEVEVATAYKDKAFWTILGTLTISIVLGLVVGFVIYRRIAGNMNTMIKLQGQLQEANQGLEKKVEERTRAINRILTNVKSGFLLVESDLKIQDGFTASCAGLFEKNIKAGMPLHEALGCDARAAEHFNSCLIQIFDDFLPESVTVDQTPQFFHLGNKTIKLEGSVVRSDAGQVQQILFTVTDVTKLVQIERDMQISRAIIKILQEKEAFASYVADTRSGFATARQTLKQGGEGEKKLRMLLHTIKGNSAAFGLTAVAELVHHIEDKTAIGASDLDKIENSIKEFLTKHATVLKIAYDNDSGHSNFNVDMKQLGKVMAAVETAPTKDDAVESLKEWIYDLSLKPAKALLGPVDDLVSGLADRLGKEVRLQVSGSELMLDPDQASPILRNLVHVLRNSIDHGIEGPLQRGSKPAKGTIDLRFFEDKQSWGVRISDDGRGVDVERIKEKAVKMGLVSKAELSKKSATEIFEFLFAEGLSTAESTTDISGRGVGMGAIRSAAEAAGGTFAVESSKQGVGTTFKLVVPKNGRGKANGMRKAA